MCAEMIRKIAVEQIMFAGLGMGEFLFRSSYKVTKKRAFTQMNTQPQTGFRNVPVQMAQLPSKVKVVRKTGQAISDAEASTSRRRSLKMQREQMESDRMRKSKV